MNSIKRRITPSNIVKLDKNQIFVFGSNERGVHGAGAALSALEKFNARYGRGYGLQGNSFAIPTKDEDIKTLPLMDIQGYVNTFISFARRSPHRIYLVTEIGCGLAGYTPEEIGPLFLEAYNIDNIWLPKKFWNEIMKFEKSGLMG